MKVPKPLTTQMSQSPFGVTSPHLARHMPRETRKRRRSSTAVTVYAPPAPKRRSRAFKKYGGFQPPRLGFGTLMLNPMREKVTTFCKTQYAVAYFNSTSFSSVGMVAAMLFDPSGTYGGGLSSAGSMVMPDWTYLNVIFDKYKVNWIETQLVVNNSDTVATPEGVVIWQRYNYDTSLAVGTGSITCTGTQGFQEWSNIQADTISVDKQNAVYRFTPKIAIDVLSGGILSTSGQKLETAGWMDVAKPVPLYGMLIGAPYGCPSGVSLTLSVTYNVSFKENV